MPDALLVCHLGEVPYAETAVLQERLRERVIDRELGDLMLVLEHPPPYTLGRRSDLGQDLPLGEEWCRQQGIEVVRTTRGGKLTYHGPGQLVGYPIMRVVNVLRYILAPTTPACGWRSARSPRSACTCTAASPPTGTRST